MKVDTETDLFDTYFSGKTLNLRALYEARNAIRLSHYGTKSGFHHGKYDKVTKIVDDYLDKYVEATIGLDGTTANLVYEDLDTNPFGTISPNSTERAKEQFENAIAFFKKTLEEHSSHRVQRTIIESFEEDMEPYIGVTDQYV